MNTHTITTDELIELENTTLQELIQKCIEREETLREMAEVGIDWSADWDIDYTAGE